MQPSPHAGRRWRPLKILLVVLGGVVGLLLLLVAAVVLLVDEGALLARVRDQALPQASERIGREIQVGDLGLDLLPAPTVRLDAVSVEGVGDQPLVAADYAVARLDLWALLLSLGKEVRLESLTLHGVEANLVRHANGTWDYESILERLDETQEAEARGGSKRRFAVDRVRIEDGLVRVIDRAAPGGVAIAEWRGVNATARNIEPGETLSLDLEAALQSNTPNLRASLQIDPLPTDMAALDAGDWPAISGSLQVRDAPLGSLRNLLPAGLAEVATGGRVRLSGEIQTEGESWVATGSGGIADLQLRGEPSNASFSFRGEMDPATKATSVSLQDILVEGPGIDLGGTAQARTEPMRFEFALSGPLLDLDTLLGVMPPGEERAEGEPLVPPSMQQSLQQASGSGTLDLERLVSGNLTATDVHVRATLAGGVLTLEDANARFYGGTVRAGGTTANLAEAAPTWRLQAQMEGVQLAQAMQEIAGTAPVDGTLQSNVDLRGVGAEWEAMRDALTGSALLLLAEGSLSSVNLDTALASQIEGALRQLGQDANAERVARGAGTHLRDLRTRVRVEDGWMVLREPLRVQTAAGPLELSGRIGLDWALDLQGTARLSPDFVASLTGGRLRPDGPVALPLNLGGTLQQPAVGGIETEAIARALLPTGQVRREVDRQRQQIEDRARREAQRKAQDVLRDVF